MSENEGPLQVTDLLAALSAGRPDAAEKLLPLVYEELRSLARRERERGPGEVTLEPTALVHEAFMRLAGSEGAEFEHRRHFFDVAAKAMRRILVDQFRARRRLKRGGDRPPQALVEEPVAQSPREDLEALDLALGELEAAHPEHARVVELRYFGGLSVAEVADVTGRSERTVKREWRFARAWLIDHLA